MLMGNWSGMGNWGGMGPGMGWVFLLLMIAGIAALVVLTVRLATGGLNRGGHRPPEPRGGSARAILDERYARGEIDHAEYDERVARLRDAP
ncbi:SHOCT domain-containing protein [Microbacterium oleivorans]|uniref:SHOCT domain-containing protein n=1 Tax=Microbacterium TaxID=33882 RepID=UPI000A593FAF